MHGAIEISADTLGLGGTGTFWVRGTLPPPPRLAIVGARAARTALRSCVDPAVAIAAERGMSVVSGGALGIDADAHEAALRHGVPQLAILPCGPDRWYPPEHAPLFEAIVRQGGAVLCTQAPGAEFTRGMFASRNRWIVAASARVLVVQAEVRSGSVLTGRLALTRGVPTAALVGSAGCMQLASRGATAIAWDPEAPDRFRAAFTAWLDRRTAPAEAWPESLQWLQQRLRERGAAGITIDALTLDDPERAVLALTRAEAMGLVAEVSPGRYLARHGTPSRAHTSSNRRSICGTKRRSRQ